MANYLLYHVHCSKASINSKGPMEVVTYVRIAKKQWCILISNNIQINDGGVVMI